MMGGKCVAAVAVAAAGNGGGETSDGHRSMAVAMWQHVFLMTALRTTCDTFCEREVESRKRISYNVGN